PVSQGDGDPCHPGHVASRRISYDDNVLYEDGKMYAEDPDNLDDPDETGFHEYLMDERECESREDPDDFL
ncbi:MAG: hypothetical protein N2C14_28945, partial [Planctomycetales bacterium]